MLRCFLFDWDIATKINYSSDFETVKMKAVNVVIYLESIHITAFISLNKLLSTINCIFADKRN